ncbi:MAG: DMT family transporter [Lachnospiraceae bacterium]
MKKKNYGMLVLTAMIWGFAFVAQREGGNAIGPFTFCATRFLLAAFALIPVVLLMDRLGLSGQKPQNKKDWAALLWAGAICGALVSGATIFQQLGLYEGVPVGKVGFLTACYIVLVPILGLFFGKKCKWNVWVAVALTVAGLYFLCLTETFSFQKSDIIVLLCSVLCAFHIIAVGRFGEKYDPIRLSCVQFFAAFLVSLFPCIFVEIRGMEGGIGNWLGLYANKQAWIAILYAGIMSSAVGYTLQILGQRGTNPTIASLLMSLESVFSVLAGWLLLLQTLGMRELLGCVFIFVAVVLAQI